MESNNRRQMATHNNNDNNNNNRASPERGAIQSRGDLHSMRDPSNNEQLANYSQERNNARRRSSQAQLSSINTAQSASSAEERTQITRSSENDDVDSIAQSSFGSRSGTTDNSVNDAHLRKSELQDTSGEKRRLPPPTLGQELASDRSSESDQEVSSMAPSKFSSRRRSRSPSRTLDMCNYRRRSSSSRLADENHQYSAKIELTQLKNEIQATQQENETLKRRLEDRDKEHASKLTRRDAALALFEVQCRDQAAVLRDLQDRLAQKDSRIQELEQINAHHNSGREPILSVFYATKTVWLQEIEQARAKIYLFRITVFFAAEDFITRSRDEVTASAPNNVTPAGLANRSQAFQNICPQCWGEIFSTVSVYDKHFRDRVEDVDRKVRLQNLDLLALRIEIDSCEADLKALFEERKKRLGVPREKLLGAFQQYFVELLRLGQDTPSRAVLYQNICDDMSGIGENNCQGRQYY